MRSFSQRIAQRGRCNDGPQCFSNLQMETDLHASPTPPNYSLRWPAVSEAAFLQIEHRSREIKNPQRRQFYDVSYNDARRPYSLAVTLRNNFVLIPSTTIQSCNYPTCKLRSYCWHIISRLLLIIRHSYSAVIYSIWSRSS